MVMQYCSTKRGRGLTQISFRMSSNYCLFTLKKCFSSSATAPFTKVRSSALLISFSSFHQLFPNSISKIKDVEESAPHVKVLKVFCDCLPTEEKDHQ